MSVLIKGCPMPSGCATCPFCSEPFEEKDGSIYYSCRVNVDGARGNEVSSIVDAMYRCAKKGELITMRPDWCPLVEVPSAEPKKGKWMLWNEPGNENAYCSVCNAKFDQDDLYIGGTDYPKYCPECGAKMSE